MANALSPLKLYRKNFGKIERIVEISNLIEMQKESYYRFLQKDLAPEGAFRIRPARGVPERLSHPGLQRRLFLGVRGVRSG